MTSPAAASCRRRARALVNACAARQGVLTGRVSRAVLAIYGIRTPREILAASFEEAVVAANEIGYPVALKAEAPGLLRAAEAGAVILDVADEAMLRRGFKRVLTNAWSVVPAFSVNGVLVQEMVASGTEVVISMGREAQEETLPGEVHRRFSDLCRDLGDLVQEIEVTLLVGADGDACAVDCLIVPNG